MEAATVSSRDGTTISVMTLSDPEVERAYVEMDYPELTPEEVDALWVAINKESDNE